MKDYVLSSGKKYIIVTKKTETTDIGNVKEFIKKYAGNIVREYVTTVADSDYNVIIAVKTYSKDEAEQMHDSIKNNVEMYCKL